MKYIIAYIIMMLSRALSVSSKSNITKQGTAFIQKEDSAKSVKTESTFRTSDGKVYPIYLSSNNKAYIVRISKKAGIPYKHYLPEVTKQLCSYIRSKQKQ